MTPSSKTALEHPAAPQSPSASPKPLYPTATAEMAERRKQLVPDVKTKRIRGHTKAARREGASDQELMEAIWVAAEMRAGGAYAHATLALDTAAP